ncbi:MAG: SDR family oxidoreductase [Planctomycetia bacterium]|nr:MAG: SDR family oxidoreductase [Planctomycetia bacterium]
MRFATDKGSHVALVTGASSGIGVEFARLLARRGSELVISARRRDRLEKLRHELQSAHGVPVTVIPCDLARPDGPQQLVDQVGDLGKSVTVLINNAGFGAYGPVVEQDLDEIEAMIQVNVTSLTMLARFFAADMGRRGAGFILNVASFAALQPIPRYAVYSGTKAYVIALSQALRHEARRHGVQVSTLVPGFTTTEFHLVARHRKTRMMRWTSLKPAQVARAGLDGLSRGKAIIVPGLWYKAAAMAARVMPRQVASELAAAVVKS